MSLLHFHSSDDKCKDFDVSISMSRQAFKNAVKAIGSVGARSDLNKKKVETTRLSSKDFLMLIYTQNAEKMLFPFRHVKGTSSNSFDLDIQEDSRSTLGRRGNALKNESLPVVRNRTVESPYTL